MFDSISKIKNYDIKINSSTIDKLENFQNLILSLKVFSNNNNALDTANHILNKSFIINYYKDEGSLESFNRIENIEELINGINDFMLGQNELYESDKSLSKYLEDVALYSETDKNIESNKVSLMTIHMAKGLEFPIVYVVGLEENLFPSIMSINSREEIEEERRLFYVAMTRAEKKLILSYCNQRFKWGNIVESEPSRFLFEIDNKFTINNNIQRETPSIDNKLLRIKKIRTKPTLSNLKKIKKDISNNIINININVDDNVFHERFGKGKVIEIEYDGNNSRATINFQNSGQKKVLLRFAKLKILK